MPFFGFDALFLPYTTLAYFFLLTFVRSFLTVDDTSFGKVAAFLTKPLQKIL